MDTSKELKVLAGQDRIIWRGHALRRMIERKIRRKDVKAALLMNEVIEEYPDDFPFPSYLILGYSENKPLHIVCSSHQSRIWVITAYEPSIEKWEDNFRERRR